MPTAEKLRKGITCTPYTCLHSIQFYSHKLSHFYCFVSSNNIFATDDGAVSIPTKKNKKVHNNPIQNKRFSHTHTHIRERRKLLYTGSLTYTPTHTHSPGRHLRSSESSDRSQRCRLKHKNDLWKTNNLK